MIIREAAEADFEVIWPIFHEVVSAQDTYAYDPAISREVCNCGYMVSGTARGPGLATAMCEHSQSVALEMGYKAMQFNLVVETNQGAVRLWQKLGFEIVGTMPKAFEHVEHGYVGAHVMFKWLAENHG